MKLPSYTACVTLSLWQLASGSATPTGSRSTTFVVDQYQLYPENADVSGGGQSLIAYGSLYNASTAIYDPARQEITDIITYPGITHNPKQHCGGVRWDRNTSDRLYVLSDAGDAFDTSGEDIAGDNILIKYDLSGHKELWRKNLTQLTRGRYGGYQDLDTNESGEQVFVVGSFPSSILRINSDGSNLVDWWGPTTTNTSVKGVSGIARFGNKFLSPVAGSGKLLKFDMGDDNGTSVEVKVHGGNLTGSDGAHLPPTYQNKVLLVAVHPMLNGSSIAVVESQDGLWNEATYLGEISDPVAGTLTSASFSLGGRIYMDAGLYLDGGSSAGNQTQFTMVDITNRVAALVAKADPSRKL